MSSSIAEHLARRLKEEGYGTRPVNGAAQGDWVLVDAGDVIVHVFRPEVRDYYDLEGMWSSAAPQPGLSRICDLLDSTPSAMRAARRKARCARNFCDRARKMGRNMGFPAVALEELPVSKAARCRRPHDG